MFALVGTQLTLSAIVWIAPGKMSHEIIRSKFSTERCGYSRCPFQQFLHEYGCNNKHYREKEAYHTRLFVCKTCGMRHPDKAMQTVGQSTVLCAICAEDRVRVQAVCSHDDDSSSSDESL